MFGRCTTWAAVHDFDLVGSNIDPAATLGLSRLSVVYRLGFRSNFAYVVDGLDGQDTSPAGTRFRSGNYRNEATIRPGQILSRMVAEKIVFPP